MVKIKDYKSLLMHLKLKYTNKLEIYLKARRKIRVRIRATMLSVVKAFIHNNKLKEKLHFSKQLLEVKEITTQMMIVTANKNMELSMKLVPSIRYIKYFHQISTLLGRM
jgi:hypothetical protein